MDAFVLPGIDIHRSTAGARRGPGPVLQQWLDNDGRIVAEGGRDARVWWMHWRDVATFRFGKIGGVTAEAGRTDDSRVQDVFTRAVVPVVLLARGFEGFHASAVRDPSGVIGLCGTSGTGKSTLAYALSAAGVEHFADDALVYAMDEGRPIALRLPYPVRVESSVFQAAGQRVLPFEKTRPVASAPLRRIYQLTRDLTADPHAPRFVPVEPAHRFKVLLTHARPFDLDGDARRGTFLSRLLTVAQTTDVWQCCFSPSLEALPSLAGAVRDHARTQ